MSAQKPLTAKEADPTFQANSDNLRGVITLCAIELGGEVVMQDSSMLSVDTKDLIHKHQSIKASK